jgi:RHS repeat-associated protein
MLPVADPERAAIGPTVAYGPAVEPEAAELAPVSPHVGPLGWAAPRFDAETALLYNVARCYDPTPGRWVSQDPIGFEADDMNLYRYVGQGGGDGAPS